MDYFEVVNIVHDAWFDSIKIVRYEMRKHLRKIELSVNRTNEIKSIISSLNYETSLAGRGYIASNYYIGESFVEIRDRIACFYVNHPIISRIKDGERINFIKEDIAIFFPLFFQEIELRKLLLPDALPQQAYSSDLLDLFKGHRELISQFIGKSDIEIAVLIKDWASQRDKFGRPLIENPENNLRSLFASELKKSGLIKCSERTFRSYL